MAKSPRWGSPDAYEGTISSIAKIKAIQIYFDQVMDTYFAKSRSHLPFVLYYSGFTQKQVLDSSIIMYINNEEYQHMNVKCITNCSPIDSALDDGNYFTWIVDESSFNHVVFSNDNEPESFQSVSENTRYQAVVTVKIDGRLIELKSDLSEATTFGEWGIPIYEIGDDLFPDNNFVYKQDMTDINENNLFIKSAQMHTNVTDPYANVKYTLPHQGINFSDFELKRDVDFYGNFKIQIKYRTKESFPKNMWPMEIAIADERRTAGVMVYYGFKTINTEEDDIRIVDPTKKNTDVRLSPLAANNPLIVTDWGKDGYTINRSNSVFKGVTTLKGLYGTAKEVVKTISLMKVGGWIAVGTLKMLYMGVGVASTIINVATLDLGDKEMVMATNFGGICIIDKHGSLRYSLMRPQIDVQFDENGNVIEGTVLPHTIVVGPNDSPFSSTGEKEENWKLYMETGTFISVEMGDFISPFISTSIKASSPSGTWAGFSHELQISVRFNSDDDRGFYIFSNNNP